MPKPGELKTVQSRILKYAQEISWQQHPATRSVSIHREKTQINKRSTHEGKDHEYENCIHR
jgi:hypothetical protein